MRINRVAILLAIVMILIVLALQACDPVGPTPTPTSTSIVPTETVPAPTETSVPPTITSTAIPPTATKTPVPPTSTPSGPTATPIKPPESGSMWLSPQEISALPDNGPAWATVLKWADTNDAPDVSNQDDNGDAVAYAAALVYARTGNEAYLEKAIAQIEAAIGTDSGGRTLGVGRNLAAYVIAADLIGYRTPAFEDWLVRVMETTYSDGRTIRETHNDRPNNWGTNAGMSRTAIAIYLNDEGELQDAADVMHGWLGNRAVYASFDYGSLSWQADPSNPVGINPVGSMIQGHSVDGVLPDDQRRAGGFKWPPPCENYVWGALQGALAQAWLLHQAGYPVFEWEDNALMRAVRWEYEQANCRASGDDAGLPYMINAVYGTSFATNAVSDPGKNGLGLYDWQFSN